MFTTGWFCKLKLLLIARNTFHFSPSVHFAVALA